MIRESIVYSFCSLLVIIYVIFIVYIIIYKTIRQ